MPRCFVANPLRIRIDSAFNIRPDQKRPDPTALDLLLQRNSSQVWPGEASNPYCFSGPVSNRHVVEPAGLIFSAPWANALPINRIHKEAESPILARIDCEMSRSASQGQIFFGAMQQKRGWSRFVLRSSYATD